MLLGPIFSIDMLTTARGAVLRLAGDLWRRPAAGAVLLLLRSHRPRDLRHPRDGRGGRELFRYVRRAAVDRRSLGRARPGGRHGGPGARAADDRISVRHRSDEYRDRAGPAGQPDAVGRQHRAGGLAAVCPGPAVRRHCRRAAAGGVCPGDVDGAVHRGAIAVGFGQHAQGPRCGAAVLRDPGGAVDGAGGGQLGIDVLVGSGLADRDRRPAQAALPVYDALCAAFDRRGQLGRHCRCGRNPNRRRRGLHAGRDCPGAANSPAGSRCRRGAAQKLVGLALGAAAAAGGQSTAAVEGAGRTAVESPAGGVWISEPGAARAGGAGAHARARWCRSIRWPISFRSGTGT